jgi:FKBP-type peptidyl-prolyl cis-trans isomerase FkpA
MLAGLLALPGFASAQGGDEPSDEKTLYFLGTALGRSLTTFDLTKEELGFVVEGLEASLFGGGEELDPAVYGPKLDAFSRARQARVAEKEREASASFLKEQAAAKGATSTDSGLIIVTLSEGEGASPAASDTVKVHYHGTLRDGTVFDSSVDRGTPAEFPLNRVIPCWTEGLQLLKVGGKARLVCPPDIAYGDKGAPPTIPGGAALVFEVELIEIVKP